jgi:hypothetical protein
VKHIVNFSTGIGSAEVLRRVYEEYGRNETIALTADTLVEDDDNWRFAREVMRFIGGCRWVILADGRTPMQVGRDHRCVPNNRMAVCSRVLKRELLERWLEENANPETDLIYLGYDWTEPNRLKRAEPNWLPWRIACPLMDEPFLWKGDLIEVWRKDYGVEPPRLYAEGFSHANCGGCCVRAGQAEWRKALTVHPERYAEWEAQEEETRKLLGKNVTILRDRTGGTSRPLSLKEFRERLQKRPTLFDSEDYGMCGCDP